MESKSIGSFDKLIDGWVLDRLRKGARNFDNLLISLPGVYPSEVLNSLDRLVSPDVIHRLMTSDARSQFVPTVRALAHECGRPRMPIEHPLDYDWRFSSMAVGQLLGLSRKFTRPDDSIVMLGVPTVFVTACETKFPRKIAIIDSNPRVAAYIAEMCSSGSIYNLNVSEDTLPALVGGVVIVDPPWYEDYIRSFLWAAASMCKHRGHLLLSAPPIGTRPNVLIEFEKVLTWADRSLGLTVVEKRRMHLPYITPFFEHNALRTAGFRNPPREWRRADLLVLKRSREVLAPRPPLDAYREQEFSIEETIDDVRIRVRNQNDSDKWRDPSLVSIVEGDVLQSVSRRDERRMLADVWTSGNRIFACAGKVQIACILHALACGRDPEQEVAAMLRRDLNPSELAMVVSTASQLRQIVSIERREVLTYRGEVKPNGSAIPADC